MESNDKSIINLAKPNQGLHSEESKNHCIEGFNLRVRSTMMYGINKFKLQCLEKKKLRPQTETKFYSENVSNTLQH